jgi:hypothetical protein
LTIPRLLRPLFRRRRELLTGRGRAVAAPLPLIESIDVEAIDDPLADDAAVGPGRLELTGEPLQQAVQLAPGVARIPEQHLIVGPLTEHALHLLARILLEAPPQAP